MKQKYWLALLILLCLVGTQMNGVQAQQPVVYAVLFFSPTCENCHYVITNILPPLQEQYGAQLEVVYVDISVSTGSTIFYAMCDTLGVPEDQCGYTPTLVIGTTVVVGRNDIQKRISTLIRDGIAAGGVDLPSIPGIRERYEAATASEAQSSTPTPISSMIQEVTWQDRLVRDKLGNSFALNVLGLLIVGLAAQLGYGWRQLGAGKKQQGGMGRTAWLFILLLAMMTTVIAGTLVLENGDISLPAVLAAGVTLGLAVVVWTIAQADRHPAYSVPGWVLPLVACLGLLVAGYLAYVETGENKAACGAVGDCNTVQQSEYAELFGLIPIGVLGMFGYILILAAWAISRYATGWAVDAAQIVLLGCALLGTVFSIYLTFLEPFVIGASCAWCLTSAMLMILILCLQAPAGWAAVNRQLNQLVPSE